ncbi:hypothetical protein [Cellulophaga baltica]|uniref:Uncharacterized protein n=1 Tax=Cellulophaga baltica TaxID=76594 RepID=A0A1G7M0U8_9FLAO|nr:hypothetical protein [Cellulophaga baltica]SDF55425.1 hypothetical protein SAMN04487992_1265 [Cellulophaga baltica]
MIKIANFSSRQLIAFTILLISLFHAQAIYFQSIFTESAATYSSLHLIETKGGRSAWSDFYSHEVSDVLVLENNNHVSKTFFLIRNNTLINVQAIFAVGLIGDWAERQAFSGAISTDGRTAMQIFIQNTWGAFGNVARRCTSIIEYSV